MKIKINKHLRLLKPYYRSYVDEETNEIDHSVWWLCFIITWTEKNSCGSDCGCN